MLENVKNRLRKSKYFAWTVERKELWLFNKHSVALGAAIGVFFGLLIPVFQAPFSALLSILLRANIGVAALATLITNPITFGPVYYGAYRFGEYITGIRFIPMGDAEGFFQWIAGVGKPLMVGLGIFSIIGFVLTYGLVYSLFNIKKLFKKPAC